MRTVLMGGLLGLVFCDVIGAGVARAQAPPPAPAEASTDPKQQAKELYEEGKRLYNVGEFDRAIAAWKKGYELHPSPDFLFNIGQAYRRKPENRQALFFYQRYLREKPNAANRPEVETIIKELEEAVAAETPTPTSRPVEQTPGSGVPGDNGAEADAATGTSLKTAGLITGGAGVAIAATGVVLLVLASSAAKDLEKAAEAHDPWTSELADKERAGERNATLGAVGVGVGVAALLAGGGLYLYGWKKGRASATAAIGPHGASALVELRF